MHNNTVFVNFLQIKLLGNQQHHQLVTEDVLQMKWRWDCLSTNAFICNARVRIFLSSVTVGIFTSKTPGVRMQWSVTFPAVNSSADFCLQRSGVLRSLGRTLDTQALVLRAIMKCSMRNWTRLTFSAAEQVKRQLSLCSVISHACWRTNRAAVRTSHVSTSMTLTE